MKYLTGLFFGFSIGILFINFVLREHSMNYKQGFEAGKTEAMKQIELSNGITNMDSSIAALKSYPNDSLNIAIFNLYATDEERAFLVEFANWIKRIKEVRE